MSNTGILKAGRPSSTKSKAATLASLADNKVYKRLNINIEEETHKRLKMYALSQDKTVTEILTAYIERITK
jgi:hypothetical protein